MKTHVCGGEGEFQSFFFTFLAFLFLLLFAQKVLLKDVCVQVIGTWQGGQRLLGRGEGSTASFSTGVMFSPNQVMGGCRTHSVSALLLVYLMCFIRKSILI